MCDSQTQTDVHAMSDSACPESETDYKKICSVCYIEDVDVIPIENYKLIELYSILGLKFNVEYGSVNRLCYGCLVDVQRCRRFYSNVQKSEKMLRELFYKGTLAGHRRVPERVAILWRTEDSSEGSGWRQLRIYREGAPMRWPRFIANPSQE